MKKNFQVNQMFISRYIEMEDLFQYRSNEVTDT